MNVLYLAHCVPNPPNKGEKIRAFHELEHLTKRHRVHVACFARTEQELRFAEELADYCDSVHAEVLSGPHAFARASLKFALGGCINTAFYKSRRMEAYVKRLTGRINFDAAVAYALPMLPYAPPGVPVLFDMQDVDSEKWLEYARRRRPGFLYRLEARRLRTLEIEFARRSQITFLTSIQEGTLLRSLAPSARIECMENGVDSDLFDPEQVERVPSLERRRFVVFVGTMDYYPNIDAVHWFATEIFQPLRQRWGDLEFMIVGNRPSRLVRQLGSIPGVVVTGGVPDVRPYILASRAVVAPLRLARGIQNKVLEALMLGRCVFTTSAVFRTFGNDVPSALVRCDCVRDYVENLSSVLDCQPDISSAVRQEMCLRSSWKANLAIFLARLEEIGTRQLATVH